jgi:hypothetical protein
LAYVFLCVVVRQVGWKGGGEIACASALYGAIATRRQQQDKRCEREHHHHHRQHTRTHAHLGRRHERRRRVVLAQPLGDGVVHDARHVKGAHNKDEVAARRVAAQAADRVVDLRLRQRAVKVDVLLL